MGLKMRGVRKCIHILYMRKQNANKNIYRLNFHKDVGKIKTATKGAASRREGLEAVGGEGDGL